MSVPHALRLGGTALRSVRAITGTVRNRAVAPALRRCILQRPVSRHVFSARSLSCASMAPLHSSGLDGWEKAHVEQAATFSLSQHMDEVVAAQSRVSGQAILTPVMTSPTLNKRCGAEFFFKCENFQKGGSFKYRGAVNALSLLTDEQKERGVVTNSSGNHGQALALAASKLGIKATIVMPVGTPQPKLEAVAGYGGHIVRCDPTIQARVAATMQLVESDGYALIPPAGHLHIIYGAATAATELFAETGQLDTVICCLGGGGVLSGTSIATKAILGRNTHVIGAEPLNADDAFHSLQRGVIQPASRWTTMADGLRTPITPVSFAVMRRFVDKVQRVTEEEIVDAMHFLWERMKLVVEPSGAVSTAAAIRLATSDNAAESDLIRGKRVGIIVTGGNVDISPQMDAMRTMAKANIEDSKRQPSGLE